MNKLVIGIILILLLGHVSCEQNTNTLSDVDKSELIFEKTATSKSTLNETESTACSISDSLKEKFTDFNNNKTTLKANEILKFVTGNKDKIIQSSCSLLSLQNWFVDEARMTFIKNIDSLNRCDEWFNGVGYLYNISILYNTDVEMDEFIRGIIAKMAFEYPAKFLETVEELNNKKDFLLFPSWEIINVEIFTEKVYNSKNFKIIDSVLTDYVGS